MSTETFLPATSPLDTPHKTRGTVTWRCPSNIALVKYWGKREEQLPSNPSISLTLSEAYTETRIDYQISDEPSILFSFEGKTDSEFVHPVTEFLDKLDPYFVFLSQLKLEIHSHNSFPHSAGIASSASAMGALALCLCTIEEELTGFKSSADVFYRKASYIARLGSGSATRSIYGGAVLWGKLTEVHGSSDLYGHPMGETPFLDSIDDAILLVSSSKKAISSSEGHALMYHHPYAAVRFEQARKHAVLLLDLIKEEDYFALCQLVEEEAMTLHAMMMTSSPGFLLLAPETIQIIGKIRAFRESAQVPICFSLDAGPNVHLLYPNQYKSVVVDFIKDQLLMHCENGRWLDDHVGPGPMLIERN